MRDQKKKAVYKQHMQINEEKSSFFFIIAYGGKGKFIEFLRVSETLFSTHARDLQSSDF
jgi:hypothetical protein